MALYQVLDLYLYLLPFVEAASQSDSRFTSAGLRGGVSKVAGSTALTTVSLGVVQTLETLAGLGVTAVWNAVVDVAVTHTASARSTRHQRVAVVVLVTSVTAHP